MNFLATGKVRVSSSRTGNGALADPAAYPKRGMTVQYQESDLAFLKRLLAEEGLFCWFEHRAEAGEPLGRHSLIIADHNGAFAPNLQARIRYTQAGATLSDDSLDQWHGLRQIDTSTGQPCQQLGLPQPVQPSAKRCQRHRQRPTTAHRRLARPRPIRLAEQRPRRAHARQPTPGHRCTPEAIPRARHRPQRRPGTTFMLADHPEHDRDTDEHRQFLITAVTHEARNGP